MWRLISAQITGTPSVSGSPGAFGNLPTPDDRTLFVLFESRAITPVPDVRLVEIAWDDREFVVPFENRILVPTAEDRAAEADDEIRVLAIS